jgi:hypothetical protein
MRILQFSVLQSIYCARFNKECMRECQKTPQGIWFT